MRHNSSLNRAEFAEFESSESSGGVRGGKGVRMIFAPAGRGDKGVRTPTEEGHGAKKTFLTPFLHRPQSAALTLGA